MSKIEALCLYRERTRGSGFFILETRARLRPAQSARELGGASRDRTDDLKLAKLALSQLSYGPNSLQSRWWAEKELNLRPHAYQACALTT